MATGGNDAQVLVGNVKCDLCQNSIDVDWKCINCDQILCNNCKQMHLKIKALRHHVVVDLRSENQQQMYSILFCTEHPKEAFQMYCLTCSCPNCLVCITEKHKSHNFEKLEKVIERKRREVDAALDQIKRTKLVSLTSAQDIVIQVQTEYDKKLEKLISEIKERAEELKCQINEIRDKLIHDLRNKGKQDREMMNHVQDQVNAQLKSLRKMIEESECKLQASSHTEVIRTADDILSSIRQLDPCPAINPLPTPTFVKGSTNQTYLKEMFGHLTQETKCDASSISQDSSVSEAEPKVNIISSFQHSETIDWIVPSNVNQVWIGKKKTNYLHLFSYAGVLIKSISVGFRVRDIALSSTGEILATTYNGKTVRKITKADKVEKFVDTSSFITRKITTTENGDTLVSLSDNRKGRVVRFSSNGQTKQVIDPKDDKSSLLSRPYSMTENTNGDVWIISAKTSGRCIIVVDRNGMYKFTYRGSQQHQKAMLWFSGIVHDKSGNILVSDIGNGTVHLVDKDGVFLQYILTKKDGIDNLKSLAIDATDQLLVGCQDGRVSILKYL